MKLFLPYYDFYAFGGFYHGVSLRLSDEENPLDRIRIRTAFFFKVSPADAAFLSFEAVSNILQCHADCQPLPVASFLFPPSVLQ